MRTTLVPQHCNGAPHEGTAAPTWQFRAELIRMSRCPYLNIGWILHCGAMEVPRYFHATAVNNVDMEGNMSLLSYYMVLAHSIDYYYTNAHKRSIGVDLGYATISYEVSVCVKLKVMGLRVGWCLLRDAKRACRHGYERAIECCMHARAHAHERTQTHIHGGYVLA